MLDQISGTLLTIFGAIITLAIVSVFVGRQSKAPAVIQAATGGLAKIVGSAVNPIAGGSASPQSNAQTTPAVFTPTALLPGLLGT